MSPVICILSFLSLIFFILMFSFGIAHSTLTALPGTAKVIVKYIGIALCVTIAFACLEVLVENGLPEYMEWWMVILLVFGFAVEVVIFLLIFEFFLACTWPLWSSLFRMIELLIKLILFIPGKISNASGNVFDKIMQQIYKQIEKF